MTALYIISAILLLLFLLMLVKVRAFASYSDELKLSIKVLFLSFDIFPEKKKEKKKSRKKKAVQKKKKPVKRKEKKPSAIKKLIEKKGLSGLLSLITQLAKIVGGALKGLFSHIIIKKMNFRLSLCGDNAADTALKYGKVCPIVYSSVAVIARACVCEDYSIAVTPDFDEDAKTKIDADLNCYIRVFWLLIHAVKALIKLLIVKIKL